MELIDLSNKTALVTGGSRGVGRATAELLARAGADVGVTYHSRANDAQQTVRRIESLGRRGWAQQARMENEADIHQLFAVVDREFADGLDIFVANAGIWPPDDIGIVDMQTAQWRHTFAVNLDSVFLATREAGKRMRDGGRIVFVSSTAGQRGEAYHADYAATKGALISVAKGLCVELGARNITVNCVAPGWIDTEMSAGPLNGPKRAQIERGIPLGRVATADDIAGPIVFLCSNLARHITGEVVNINGGAILCG